MKIKRDSTIFKIFKFIESGKSGEEIAKFLGISRTSVWKSVEKLREMGYSVEAKKGRGYAILSKPETSPLEIADIAFKNLKDLVCEVWYFQKTDSTNQRAREYSKPNVLFFAEEQSSGRGRMGRKWFSDRGGLYFTLTLEPRLNIEDIPKLTLTTGLAVAKALPDAKIKWPNDVLIQGKKVCGILCELIGEIENPVVIVGVGVNVKNRIPKELENKASSLSEFGNFKITDVFDRITREFHSYYSKLTNGYWREIRAEFIKNCETLGKKVRVETLSKVYEGLAEKIDEDGALIVNGERIYAGECFYLST